MAPLERRESGRSRIYRWLFNLWPCIRGTGARITFVSGDFHELHVRLPLNWRTRNRVGTIFGGSLYAAVDPFYMILLMELLGKDFVVWDKAAAIRFRRPGRDTLHARFAFTPEQVAEIRATATEKGEYVFDLEVALRDAAGTPHAEITKTMYVATREHYRRKQEARK